jgi:hypothetical protein
MACDLDVPGNSSWSPDHVGVNVRLRATGQDMVGPMRADLSLDDGLDGRGEARRGSGFDRGRRHSAPTRHASDPKDPPK